MHLLGQRTKSKGAESLELYQKIIEYFSFRGVSNLKVNAPGMEVFYITSGEECSIYWLIEFFTGTEISNELYQNIERQLQSAFVSRGFQKINVHGVLCTKQTDVAMKLCRNNRSACIVDLENSRLMLFEGQAMDPQGVFRGLEAFITSYGDLTGGNKAKNSTWHNDTQGSYSPHSVGHKKSEIFSKIGVVTAVLILINTVIYLYTELSGNYDEIVSKGCMFWPLVRYNHEYYRFITYQFLHGGISHLANNMLILGIMGSTLERHVGKVKYLIIYFMSGIVAGIASMSYNMEKGFFSTSIGASGAVFGVIGAIALIVIVNKGRLETMSTRQILLFIALSLYGGFTSQGVDNAAHVGGLLAGFFIAMLVYRKKRGRIRED